MKPYATAFRLNLQKKLFDKEDEKTKKEIDFVIKESMRWGLIYLAKENKEVKAILKYFNLYKDKTKNYYLLPSH